MSWLVPDIEETQKENELLHKAIAVLVADIQKFQYDSIGKMGSKEEIIASAMERATNDEGEVLNEY